MATVWIPSLLRDLTAGRETLVVPGRTVGHVVDALDERHPGFRDRVCDGGQLRPEIAVHVDGRLAQLGLRAPVGQDSEMQFLPAVAGG
jgi:molybdopterin synthase sulfur carrier subunit